MMNARLLRSPIGQFQRYWRVTAHTHNAPVTNPMTSTTVTVSPRTVTNSPFSQPRMPVMRVPSA